jgi:lysyl-tRNA synthetase, class II
MENLNPITNAGSERDDRLRKLEELKKLGIETYPAQTERDHEITAVLSDFDKLVESQTVFHIAGRLRAKREHGNLSFANLEDGTGSIQLAFSKKDLGVDAYKAFVKYIDVADFIEATGYAFLTHKGEKSVFVTSWKLLTKALRPLPDSWYGLKDEEDRLRKRYLDLLLNPELREMFYKKAKFRI